mmetsp:Transcript_2995/g.6347  ORF Transcript_2995/g.6347 Transcript_2995/m.6347 type:complete len:368 (-) Transcript_2995:378-1481(-)
MENRKLVVLGHCQVQESRNRPFPCLEVFPADGSIGIHIHEGVRTRVFEHRRQGRKHAHRPADVDAVGFVGRQYLDGTTRVFPANHVVAIEEPALGAGNRLHQLGQVLGGVLHLFLDGRQVPLRLFGEQVLDEGILPGHGQGLDGIFYGGAVAIATRASNRSQVRFSRGALERASRVFLGLLGVAALARAYLEIGAPTREDVLDLRTGQLVGRGQKRNNCGGRVLVKDLLPVQDFGDAPVVGQQAGGVLVVVSLRSVVPFVFRGPLREFRLGHVAALDEIVNRGNHLQGVVPVVHKVVLLLFSSTDQFRRGTSRNPFSVCQYARNAAHGTPRRSLVVAWCQLLRNRWRAFVSDVAGIVLFFGLCVRRQ